MRFFAPASIAMLPVVSGHFAVQSPATWHDPDGTLFAPGSQCKPGCTGKSAPGQVEKAQGCACEWYTNWTFIPGEPTIPAHSPLRTYKACPYGTPGSEDGCTKHPWMAPGTAPTYSPCGHDGGNPKGCPVGASALGGICAGGGYGHGPDARTLKGNTNPPKWTAGSVEEIIWGIAANHGGGISARLCKKPSADKMLTDLSEECFQKGVLRFSGDEQWVQEGPDASTRSKAFPAIRTTNGTVPAGSQWTRNPIPACGGRGGGAPAAGGVCIGTQFEPPIPGHFGFGLGGLGQKFFTFSVVDKVEIPANLEPGLYVLSVRFDCEQTPQVWFSCSDVLITK